jgi:hypothetical protein
MITQYRIRIVGDLNEQPPSLPVPSDTQGIFYVLNTLEDAAVENIRNGVISQMEKSVVTDVVREREGVTGLGDVIMKMKCIVHQFAVIAASPGK